MRIDILVDGICIEKVWWDRLIRFDRIINATVDGVEVTINRNVQSSPPEILELASLSGVHLDPATLGEYKNPLHQPHCR